MDDLGEIRLELITLPVTDVDRAKAFYADQFGFHVDYDQRVNAKLRFVQLTPPGSACSITIGKGITNAEPGSYRGIHLVVTDIEAARDALTQRGVEVSDIRHISPNGWVDGVHPEHADYESFADFADPDGNTWVLQEVRTGKTES